MPDRVPLEPKEDASVEPTDARPNEETDANTSDASDAADASRTYRAFASSGLYNGNLGGVAGADAKCQTLATNQGLTGTFKAWISVAGSNAADRITSPGPWVLPNGAIVAKTRAQLASGALDTPPDRDEKNAALPDAEDRVWTATAPNGTHAGPDCNGWTGGGNGLVGEAAHKNGQWTALVDEACGAVNRVYCFEN